MADPMVSLAVARYACLALPAALTLAAAITHERAAGSSVPAWRRRERAAALLAFIAAMVGIAALHEAATVAGWYEFAPVAAAFRGLPVDLWIGWALLWGPLPVLSRRWLPAAAALGALLWLDVLVMPRLDELVVLGPQWLIGEAVGLLAVALPAQLLGHWTARRRHLPARVLLQLVTFSGAALWLLPSTAFALGDGSWAALTGLPPARLLLLAQLALLLAVPGLAAVRELAVRGGGTPYPWDPPDRLVTTGPYAYLANPMQVSVLALLLLLAAVTGSVSLLAATGAAAAFSTAVAGPHEREHLHRRFGERWYAYRGHVRAWWPRWRPYPPTPPGPTGDQSAVLWLDLGCGACRAVGAALARRRPHRLRIAPAAAHRRVLTRARYQDGAVTADGLGGVAYGLEHLHLGWAYLGWLLRLPVVRPLAQVVTDALIAPPHPAGTPEVAASGGGRCRRRPGGDCSPGRSRRSGSTASPESRRAPSPRPRE